jgi:hypothetical protein
MSSLDLLVHAATVLALLVLGAVLVTTVAAVRREQLNMLLHGDLKGNPNGK